MGGIAAICSFEGTAIRTDLLRRMTGILRHRGPDDEGYVLANTSGGQCEPRAGDDTVEEWRATLAHIATPVDFSPDLGLGHRRLAIVDLSAAGHQPMRNEDGTVWIVHNGEVFNYVTLREELKDRGHTFRSNTDTEVILHGYEEWGEDCLNRFNGIWAFAIWDAGRGRLFCSRDRFGVKPLYYYFDGRMFLLVSEIKAILEAEFVERRTNDQAVFDYLAYWAEDCEEESFFKGIKRIPAGHCLEVRPQEARMHCRRYYRVPLDDRLLGLQDQEYAERFRHLFEESVRLNLMGEVPIGACLSGGLDSSAVVCTIDRLLTEAGQPATGSGSLVGTFSARFADERHDEGRFISAVEERVSTDGLHTHPTGAGLLEDVSTLIWHQEEPFISTMTYAKWEVFKLAHNSGARVSIDGQGGDELLAGYGRLFAVLFAHLASTFQWPQLTREVYSHVRLRGRNGLADLPRAAYHLLPRAVRPRVREVMRVDSGSFLSGDFASAYTGYLFRDRAVVDQRANLFDSDLYGLFGLVGLPALLRHEDRNSMAHSLEYRVPFLDHRLVEFAFALPWDQKIRRGTRKYVLRNAMRDILPEPVASRQDKMGLSTPEDAWLGIDLKDFVAELVNSASFQQRPYFDRRKVGSILGAFLEGRRNLGATIWRWVCLELWLRTFVDRGNNAPV